MFLNLKPDAPAIETTAEPEDSEWMEPAPGDDVVADPPEDADPPDDDDTDYDDDPEDEFVDDEEGALDLSDDPDHIVDPLQVTQEVPLGMREIEELRAHVREWKNEEPSNVFPHQVFRMLHELEQYRLNQSEMAAGIAVNNSAELQLSMVRSQLQIANDEIKRLTGAVKVAEELAKRAADDALNKSDLGPQIEDLSIHELFAAQSRLPEER